ncbi:VapC toxin family PIN domain ribonuclease [Marispirochaeta aestuarii]|uniref:Ribonuclease VapC n=1 Tax=Marispirochaeta aestuarii TaxID=1963862 RepID=A0A1Y1S2T0_9SPIO|nr:type II toxin-antitoxin system VapC family toxin [Marispirochaeta aestuarii]ORC37375.1 VapC toxin family PIN domain ribonuclease [Marispirochaeta aestuarii]
MIVLDTNVLSELMRPTPNPVVITWLDTLPVRDVALSSITVSEILFGIGLLPSGKRKDQLISAAKTLFETDFQDRIFPFDADAAVEYAAIVLHRQKSGRPISMADGQIAAICRARKCSLATRNIKDFEGTGIVLIDPWAEG